MLLALIDPWMIIGWIVLTVMVGVTLVRLVRLARLSAAKLRAYFRYLKTRDVPPAAGQVWLQEGSELHITDVYDSGKIAIGIGSGSWGESADTWRRRVRNRKLYLLRNAAPNA